MRALDWNVGVTTCPREPNTLVDTGESIAAAGFADVGLRSTAFDDFDKSLGSYGCFKKAIKEMLSWEDGGNVFVIFQDDIQVSRWLRQYLDEDEIFQGLLEKDNLISLYTAGPHHDPLTGWHRLPEKQDFYGALAVVMSRNLAEKFNANPPGAGSLTNTCANLKKFVEREKTEIWMHSPSFVRHTGDISAINEHWPESHRFYRQCGVFLETCEVLKK